MKNDKKVKAEEKKAEDKKENGGGSQLINSIAMLVLGILISFAINKVIETRNKTVVKAPYPNKDDSFKVVYFGGNGRAAIIRGIFSAMKQPFVDERIDHKKWPEIKKSGLCEFEQVPVLVHNGKTLSQSVAIYGYLARLFNIYGNNVDEQY